MAYAVSRMLVASLSLGLLGTLVCTAGGMARGEPESIVFAAKLCCADQDIQDGLWLQVVAEPGSDPAPALRRYTIRLSQTRRGVAETTYAKTLGEGGWCHIFFRGIDDPQSVRARGPAAGRFVFLWIEGQKSSAYMFGIARDTLTPLFEKSEGRGSFACQDLDGDGIYEIVEVDSAWHIRGYPLPTKMLARLGRAASGKMIYRLKGDRYRLARIEPVGDAKGR